MNLISVHVRAVPWGGPRSSACFGQFRGGENRIVLVFSAIHHHAQNGETNGRGFIWLMVWQRIIGWHKGNRSSADAERWMKSRLSKPEPLTMIAILVWDLIFSKWCKSSVGMMGKSVSTRFFNASRGSIWAVALHGVIFRMKQMAEKYSQSGATGSKARGWQSQRRFVRKLQYEGLYKTKRSGRLGLIGERARSGSEFVKKSHENRWLEADVI